MTEKAENTNRTVVAVVYGGQSTEHSVSCISAAAVIDHLDPERFDVVPVGITTEGQWVPGTTQTDTLRANGAAMPEVPAPGEGGETIQLMFGQPAGRLRYVTGGRAGELFADVDVIFPVLHGVNGEDGTIQGLFELSGVPYVGNGVLASAAGMDKEATKRLAREAGIPVGEELILRENRELTDEEKQRLGLPLFVKPARGGSSIGISKVSTWDQLAEAVDLAFAHDSKVIVEAMIYGAEVECGVLQYADGSVVASVPAQLEGTEDGAEGFYGFDAKYVDSTVTATIPAPLDAETTAAVRNLAIKTFEAVGCEGLARVDFFATDSGPVLNEINTLPGFTPISMYPKMFAAEGTDFTELVEILISRALRIRQ
ncbi:MAG TPA: D-alanine--D-alanine ligase [Candidatus Corynebacterium gallistercoris]|uniref:D-alanine--D-alanine ligase n=1 Tax=Candidatus Corynebacterium gallistercoris TaxID=2838530 RepID=A0A9D1US08_9CORY|nr:D-alanine--D-alanine ligase [Candidatus Corynebacterium gallistercoris]